MERFYVLRYRNYPHKGPYPFSGQNLNVSEYRLDSLLRQEIFLLMLYLPGIFQGGVHVAVTMSVRDSGYCLGGGLPQREGRSDTLNHEKFLFLPDSFFLLPFLLPLFHFPF